MAQCPNTRRFGLGTRGLFLCAVLLAVLCVWIFFGSQIRRAVAVQLFLHAQSPSEESFQELLGQSPDPAGFLTRCWATDRIPHRQLVAAFLKTSATAKAPWFDRVEPLILAGALDPDLSIRELAMGTLDLRSDSHLFDLAQAQLPDLDPAIRQLGLGYLQKAPAARGIPAVMPLLDDPDLRIVASAETALRRWTGQDFGVRVRLALHPAELQSDPSAAKADEQKIREGVSRRKQWWAEHGGEFTPVKPTLLTPSTITAELVQDFSLPTPSGSRVRLSDFRGRVVVLNFWATWCTACLTEIPDLVALHQKFADKLGVIGVALDGLPDEHHHPENAAAEADEHSVGKSLKQIQSKVLKAIGARGINYTVLLDPTGSVGGRFNGGELPTTVIIDGSGHVRRRFIGERSLAVFEAMVAEAAKPQP